MTAVEPLSAAGPRLHAQDRVASTHRLLAARGNDGAVLITSLLFLVVITLIGLSLFSTTTAEEKISRNARDREVAFAAAEAALRDAELRVNGRWGKPTRALVKTDFDPACATGLCDARSAAPTPPLTSRDFFDASSAAIPISTVTGSPKLPGFPDARQPRYMIEMLCLASCKEEIFRITVQARGRLRNTMVMLQELYLPPNSLTGSANVTGGSGSTASASTAAAPGAQASSATPP
jgi:type IV pilus assembly protein PilX